MPADFQCKCAPNYGITDTLLLVVIVFICTCDVIVAAVEKADVGCYVFRETLALASALLEERTIRMLRVTRAFSLQKSLPTELQQLMVA